MDIEFQLSVARNQLVIGESAAVILVLRNRGTAAVSLPDPDRTDDWPKISVRNLNTTEQASFGPHDLAKRESHQFVVPLPATSITLAPGQEFRKSADLLNWVELPAAGKYELRAEMKSDSGDFVSNAVTLTVDPLKLQTKDFAGPHSGHSTLRYTLWTHAGAQGVALLLSLANFDEEGHIAVNQSFRVAETRQVSLPVLSASANNLPYPAQWIVWVDKDQLSSLYVKQGKVEVPLRTQNLNTGPVQLVGPVLLDLSGNDGSRPGRGRLVFSQSAGQAGRLLMKTLEPDGSLKDGPQVSVPPGELVWGRGALLSNSFGRVVLAIKRGDGVDLDVVSWDASATSMSLSTKAKFQGRFIAGAITLNETDASEGALFLATMAPNGAVQYSLQPFKIDRNGITNVQSPSPVQTTRKLDKAIVGVSAEGKSAAVLKDANGRWSRVDSRGTFAELPVSLTLNSEPIDLFWPFESSLVMVMAGADSGITYKTLR